MQQIAVLLFTLAATAAAPALASKCYGDHDCTACKNCNYCKNCNSGGELCGVYYQSRGETPPWKKREAPKLPHRKNAA